MLSSFKGRVALAAAVLAAAGTIAVVSLQSHLSKRGVKESVIAQQQSLSERVALHTDETLRLAQAVMTELAGAVPARALRDPQAMHAFLADRVGVRPLFQSMQIFDLNGHWIASAPPLTAASKKISVADREWFRQSLEHGGRKVISKPLVSRLNGRRIVVMTCPIFDEQGILRALLASTVDLDTASMLGSLGKAHIGKSGYFILLARDGSIVMHPDQNLVTKSLADLGKPATPLVAALARSQTGAFEAKDQYGVHSLFTFSTVPTADWVLVGVQPHGEALAALNRLWKQMLMAGLLLSLLPIPFIWGLVSRMLQPLDALRRDIARLHDGELMGEIHSLDGRGVRELRAVRNEFRAMVQARRAAETALQREKEMMEVTLHSIGDAVIVTDADSRIRSINAVAEHLTGWRRAEAVGQYFADVFCTAQEETGIRRDDVAKRAIQEKNIACLPADTVLRTKTGRDVAVEDSAAPILDEEGKVHGAVVVFRDVGVQRAAAREISWRAMHDALTRLPNRGAFETALETAVTSMNDDSVHAMLMLDLDQFKIVNDTCGHAAGDELLKRLAALFQSRIRKSDMVARLGGDEFAVLMYHCPPEKSMRLAEELRRAIAEMRFTWEDNTFRIGASIGLVAVDSSYTSAMDVQKAADIACYMAKRSGRNRICVHSRDDHQLELMRNEMHSVSRIQQAIDENRLRVFAQHVTPISRKNESGEYFEVLVRMVDETGNLIPPGAFLPAAERYGLMDELDRWVIANTARACAEHFSADGWSRLNTVCINLSAKTLQDKSIGPYIFDQLLRNGVPFNRVCLEVTESAAIENMQNLRELVGSLRREGLRFALDDFGVGMTSLAQLRDLPVDILKIDGSFITGISHDRINSSMVGAIQNLAKLMGMKTVAECVEHPEELVHLQALGIDYAQGYLFSIPAPIEEVFANLETSASA